MYKNRIQRELLKINSNPMPGIYCHPKAEDQFEVLTAFILGQKDTPYENGKFELQISIPEKYPFAPPLIKFVTPIYHPNIDESGRICLDVLKMPPQGSWMPRISIENLLVTIQMLMGSPNPDDPLMPLIAEEYKNQPEVFVKKASEATSAYAVEIYNKSDNSTGDKRDATPVENSQLTETDLRLEKRKKITEYRTEIGQCSTDK